MHHPNISLSPCTSNPIVHLFASQVTPERAQADDAPLITHRSKPSRRLPISAGASTAPRGSPETWTNSRRIPASACSPTRRRRRQITAQSSAGARTRWARKESPAPTTWCRQESRILPPDAPSPTRRTVRLPLVVRRGLMEDWSKGIVLVLGWGDQRPVRRFDSLTNTEIDA